MCHDCTLYIKSPITCIQVNQFLTQKNGKHFVDISILSTGEDSLYYKLTIVIDEMLSFTFSDFCELSEKNL